MVPKWFRRAWVIHEYVVGAKERAIFCCGKSRLTGPNTEAFLIVADELKFQGALNLYIDNFTAILEDHKELNDYDVRDLQYITNSDETRDTSARNIFEHIATLFIRGIQAMASLKSLKDIFNIAQQNGIQSRDEHALFCLRRIHVTNFFGSLRQSLRSPRHPRRF